jgi:tRNA pseudouridine55 synthase
MDGALIIDKPAGLTSHDVIARVRKTIAERRVGHTGTLDPFATGVLVVLVGRATRLAQFLSGAEKEYEALIRFGYRTDTGDITGKQIEEEQSHAKARTTRGLRAEEIKTALASFRGEIEQTPPMYSAKKVGGRKLYELARRGEAVERKPVRVTISEFECISEHDDSMKSNDDGTQDLKVRVVCSAGTYIRTLAEDLGQQLGIGAHLAELRRTRAGKFRIEDAMTLKQLSELAESGSLSQAFISPDATLAHLPALDLSADAVRRVMNGLDMQLEQTVWPTGQAVRLRNAFGELTAVGIYDEARKRIHPHVVLASQ